MKFLKKLALAASMLLLLNTANAANEVFDLGTLNIGDTRSDNGNIAANDTDTIKFYVNESFKLNADGSFFTFDNTGHSDMTVTFLGGTEVLKSFTVASLETVHFGPELLGAGNYSFEMSTLAATSGTYTYEMSVSAVPEPSTYALMLAGLGMVGFMARRRKAA